MLTRLLLKSPLVPSLRYLPQTILSPGRTTALSPAARFCSNGTDKVPDGRPPSVKLYSNTRTTQLTPSSESGDGAPPDRQLLDSVQRQRERRLGDSVSVDLLRESLVKSSSVDSLRELIRLHHEIMNHSHVVECWLALSHIVKTMPAKRAENAANRFLASSEFQDLSRRTFKKIRFFPPQNSLDFLKGLQALNISVKSNLALAALQMIRHQINEFDIKMLIIASKILHSMAPPRQDDQFVPFNQMDDKSAADFDVESYFPSSGLTTTADAASRDRPGKPPPIDWPPIVSALRLAIPLAAQIRLASNELNYEDIAECSTVLRFALMNKFRPDLINRLLLELKLRSHKFTPLDGFSLVNTLAKFRSDRFPAIDVGLAHGVFEASLDSFNLDAESLLAEGNGLSTESLIAIFASNHLVHSPFYRPDFFKTIIKLALRSSEKISTARLCFLNASLVNHNHHSPPLNDLIISRISADIDAFLRLPGIRIEELVGSWALSATYENPRIPAIVERLFAARRHRHISERKGAKMIWLLKSLIMMGLHPGEPVLERSLSFQIADTVRRAQEANQRRYALRDIHSIYTSLWSDIIQTGHRDRILAALKPFNHEYFALVHRERSTEFVSLAAALQMAYGGENYVGRGLSTESGHYLDFVVALRPGGFPVAFRPLSTTTTGAAARDNNGNSSSGPRSLQSFHLPDGVQLLALVPLLGHDYLAEPYEIRRETQLRILTLRAQGLVPLPINMESWDLLLDRERVPYLMRLVNEGLEEATSRTSSSSSSSPKTSDEEDPQSETFFNTSATSGETSQSDGGTRTP